ncbi:MAG: hypothetical protein ACR2IL_04860 [Chitinophagaceae bacterium]
MIFDLFPLLLPALFTAVLCLLIWTQLFLRLWGKVIKGWLPTFFGAVLLVFLGITESFYWELIWENKPNMHPGWMHWGTRIAQAGLFSGMVYIGVSLWLHIFDYFLNHK